MAAFRIQDSKFKIQMFYCPQSSHAEIILQQHIKNTQQDKTRIAIIQQLSVMQQHRPPTRVTKLLKKLGTALENLYIQKKKKKKCSKSMY